MVRTHAIAQNAITQLASIRGKPHPLIKARFVSGFREKTSNMQYPTCPMYIATMKTAIMDGLGEIEEGYSLAMSPTWVSGRGADYTDGSDTLTKIRLKDQCANHQGCDVH